MHYNRWRRNGHPGEPAPKRAGSRRGKKFVDVPAKGQPCSIDGCPKPALARGWCSMHYMRWYTNGDPGPAGKIQRRRRPCKVADCANHAVTKADLCYTHRRTKHLFLNADGTYSTTKPCACGRVAVRSSRSMDHCRDCFVAHIKAQVVAGEIVPTTHAAGYAYVSVFKKRYAVHQIVMESMIGRELRPGESVHHKNGIRNDNSPSNLELWVKPQPYGQRPEDLVAWVVENYPDLVRDALDDDG